MRKAEQEQLVQELERWRGLANAFFRFVQKARPKDFNLFGLVLFSQMGRQDEMIKLLDGYNPQAEEKQEANNG